MGDFSGYRSSTRVEMGQMLHMYLISGSRVERMRRDRKDMANWFPSNVDILVMHAKSHAKENKQKNYQLSLD